jgi:isoaspartyl peptidase/L-asparaginase-like protein (Ntn-hydrolase superfamily)
MRPVIIVHGGAGRVREEEWAEHQEGCREAAVSGWQRLTQGGSALDAVEQAVALRSLLTDRRRWGTLSESFPSDR